MNPSLVPRPLPDFISQLWRKNRKIFLHSCEIKSGSGLGTRLYEPHTRIWTTIEIFKEQKEGIKGVL